MGGFQEFEQLLNLRLPLIEGKCPPIIEGGKWIYPEPDNSPDPNIAEYDTYGIEDKDEFYNYVTVCKKCGTRFIAYSDSGDEERSYCPGCGRRLD